MKSRITDALQVLVAIVITGSTAYAMQPPAPTTSTHSEASQHTKVEPEPVIAVKEAPTAPTQPVVEPIQTVAPEPEPVVVAPTPVVTPVVGTCDEWIAQAGITEVASARELIRRESGCNPNAVNPSSGACGVAQELPCGKSGCARTDGACQVAWMNRYVKSRYQSWAGALYHHDMKNWY